ncbi:MAG: DUF2271 domain-containing protein [Pseudomonadota bacterium]
MARLKTAGALALICALDFGLLATASAEIFTFRTEPLLGTEVNVTISAPSQSEAERIHTVMLDEITRLDGILSTWRTDTEISALNRGETIQLSQETSDVLKLCENYRDKFPDGFSCNIGEIIDLWRIAKEEGFLPNLDEVRALQTLASASKTVNLDAEGTGTKPTGVSLNLDSIAKGYIIDRAVEAGIETSSAGTTLQDTGILLNVGGDIRVSGVLGPEYRNIGIASVGAADNTPPVEILSLKNAAIATSGNGTRDLEIGNRQFSHIISPKTGRPQEKTSQVTVIAPTAAEADALATAFSVVGVSQSLLHANNQPGVEAMIITSGGARFTSSGWSALAAPTIKKTAEEVGIENPFPTDFELAIDYEFERKNVPEYEYPYIVMWITSPDRKLVRPLMMLGNQPRWVEENYVFWRRYGRKSPAMVETLSRPTKAPGQYRMVWDGYDQSGAPVPQGEYTLHIEASREHGDHQYLKRTFSFETEIFEDLFEQGDELGQIEIHYGPKS